MKYLTKWIFFLIAPCTFLGILLVKPDVDTPLNYGYHNLVFSAIVGLYLLVIAIGVNQHIRLKNLEGKSKKDKVFNKDI